jgi:DNA-binding transcriptional regulator YiaG
MKDIKCDCGGTLKVAKLAAFDLTEDLGIKVTAKDVQGLRCNLCGWETLPGKTLNAAMHALAAMMLQVEERLPADLARYLRKHLDLTQQELARRMGITRKTVNQWEASGPISPQHDLILRTLVYAHLAEAVRPMAGALDHVRTALPKARQPRLVVAKLDRTA